MRRPIDDLVRQTGVLEILGDMIRVRARDVALGDLAVVENVDGVSSAARVAGVDGDLVSLQVFAGAKGLSTDARVRFLDEEGFDQQVIFPTLGLVWEGRVEDPALAAAHCRRQTRAVPLPCRVCARLARTGPVGAASPPHGLPVRPVGPPACPHDAGGDWTARMGDRVCHPSSAPCNSLSVSKNDIEYVRLQ